MDLTNVRIKNINHVYPPVKRFFVLMIMMLLSLPLFGQTKKVTISTEREGEKVIFKAVNPNFFPVTLELNIIAENMSAPQKLPVIRSLPAGDQVSVAVMIISDPAVSWSYETRYLFYMGDADAQHDDRFAYRLPYERQTEHRVEQAYGGSFSHTGDAYYSLDFAMDEGTRIVAARNGLVVKVEESFSEGGNDPSFLQKANVITIMHEDGTFADYSHLKKNGAVVRSGQQVRSGQLIGYSGATGYATGPHLHFAVKKARKGGGFTTLPIKFKTRKGILTLKERTSYMAY